MEKLIANLGQSLGRCSKKRLPKALELTFPHNGRFSLDAAHVRCDGDRIFVCTEGVNESPFLRLPAGKHATVCVSNHKGTLQFSLFRNYIDKLIIHISEKLIEEYLVLC